MNPLYIGLGVGGVAVVGGIAYVLWKKSQKGAPKGDEEVKPRTLPQPQDAVKPSKPSTSASVVEDKKPVEDTKKSPPPPEINDDEFSEPFPAPEYEPFSDLVDVISGSVAEELTDAVAWLNSIDTADVDACQRLMKADIFKFLLKAVRGIRNEEGQIEETVPFHALSILAQIFTRGLSRNEQKVAETAASEFRETHGLNVVYDVSVRSKHLPSKQLAAILTAFTFAYEPLPSEYHDILPTLTDIILQYNKDSSSSFDPSDPQSRQGERLLALALHALTLLLHNEENKHLILEDYIGREPEDIEDEASPNRSTSPPGKRGFSSTSPQPHTRRYDPSSPSSYPTDSPLSQRAVNPGEVPDLPLSSLQEKIFDFITSEDKNIAAWAIRFYAVQALYMTLNEKRAFVAQKDFFAVAKSLIESETLDLDDPTLPVVENIGLALYNICLNRYDKGKSYILKMGITKELFKTLVKVDFKALGNPEQGHINPLNDEQEAVIPESLQEPLTSLSPTNTLHTAGEEPRYVDRQVHLMGIVQHTIAIFKGLHHNIECLEYVVKIGIATPISNILYNYNRKLSQQLELQPAAEESYGRFLANTLELLRYLAALGVDEVINEKTNELRAYLEKIQGIRVQENLLKSIPWDSFDYSQELSQLSYTDRGMLDLAFAYTALFAGDDAPEEAARPAFDFINQLRSSDSPLVSGEKPSLYVKYYNYVFANVNNANSF